MSTRVLVTRVQPQAQHWVTQLQDHGHNAVALPLIEVQTLPDPQAVRAAWACWPQYLAVMFVSRHAVDHFFEQNKSLAHGFIDFNALKTRAWSTGPGTSNALLAQGISAQLLDSPRTDLGQFDSEALWQTVHAQVTPGCRVLIVRGDSVDAKVGPNASGSQGVGRDWLAQRLQQAGAEVDFVVAYQRGAPHWDLGQHQLAMRGATDGSVWLFSSAEALTHLQQCLPGQDWSQAKAVATHPRIAQAAQALGFGRVAVARPVMDEVLASIESVQ